MPGITGQSARIKWIITYTHSSPNRRDVSPVFMALPDKKLFPDYYAVIPEPICLNMINVSARRPYVI